MVRLAVAAALALTFLEPNHERLTVSTYPRTVIVGQAVNVRCRVPRHPDNRWVDFGIRDYRVTRALIEGEAGPVFHEFMVTHVPCGVEVAFCRTGTSRGQSETAVVPLGVIGCET